jgi:FkbM family methyltransferase
MGVFSLARSLSRHPLARRHGRLGAYGRFLRWQFAQRLLPQPAVLPFVNDSVLVTARGTSGATGNYYFGLMEPQEMGFALHLLRDDSLFVDVGANIGAFTVLAGAGVGARVVAVEPIPATFERLQRNIAVNGIGDKVAAHRVGLSGQPGTLRFSLALDCMNHVMDEGEGGDAVDVPVTTLDDLLDGQAPTLIKIDVEGHEGAVIDGAARTLARPDLMAVIMEVNGGGRIEGDIDRVLIARMAAFGFRPHGYDPFARRLTPYDDAPNVVMVRDAEQVQARCAAAATYRLVNGTI